MYMISADENITFLLPRQKKATGPEDALAAQVFLMGYSCDRRGRCLIG